MKHSENAPRIIHVAISGDDSNSGSEDAPLRSIHTAAQLAMPGDTVRVHGGTYRESIHPARGGDSEDTRITYESVPGQLVEILGSEPVTGWEKESRGTPGTWKASVSNEIFDDFNPFATPLAGDWFSNMGRPHTTGCIYLDGRDLLEATEWKQLEPRFWTAEVGEKETTFWINCGAEDPNEKTIEVNARPTVFYPKVSGINYITVRGFTMRHAATNWAPPTAEQIGLIGTHWSKGWLIENNTITHSRCVGVTLGKYGDDYDNTSANSAEGYVATIRRAQAQGWSRETVGGHIVRHNTIAFCEQAGIVGSLGAIFSEVSGNTIHDVHVHRLFNGAEQAGIKFHAPIDTLISGNHIYRTFRGMWMDWMTQGTRITRNLCHDNIEQDLFVEVSHGPYVADNNLFLSSVSILSMSQGGAYLHNLIGGRVSRMAELERETPYHPQSSLEISGFSNIRGGDERYMNNLFTSASVLRSLSGQLDFVWGRAKPEPGKEAFPSKVCDNQVALCAFALKEEAGVWLLEYEANNMEWAGCPLVTTESLGQTRVSRLPYMNYDGAALAIDTDYSGNPRRPEQNKPGPFNELPTDSGSVIVFDALKEAAPDGESTHDPMVGS